MRNKSIKSTIISLGAESVGKYSLFVGGKINNSPFFGDVLNIKNYNKLEKSLNKLINSNPIPKVIITDLHPEFNTTKLGLKIANAYGAEHIQVQHHIAHIFSAFNEISKIPEEFIGIACDGTGLGLDGKIWGGEFFHIKKEINRFDITRVAHLENQKLIGGEKAIQEPARMLISILLNFLAPEQIFSYVKDYYTQKEFNLIVKMHQQNFNCLETSSTGRILDATSLLLGFCRNKRKYKHQPIDELEKNSASKTLLKLKPQIKKQSLLILKTTPLFECLINNLDKNKKDLAYLSQLYIAQGIEEIISIYNVKKLPVYFAGGMAKNKILSEYLNEKVYINSKIDPGDGGLSHGQLIYYLANN